MLFRSPGAAELLAKASAPNLHGFGTAAWVRGLLDPKQVAGPAYYGNTAHKDGDMVSFVQNDLTDADTWKPDDIEAVAVALAAEAGHAAADAARIEKGRGLIADGERCGSCHAFGGNGTEAGAAPDLVGWGGRDWLVGIITDPAHARFYGDSNDRMPRFGVGREGGAPVLSRREIELVADLLRGDWYRSAQH